jgi:glycosyltransferase involved in cell wall biosynthesis
MRIAIYHNLHSGGAKRTLFEEVYRLNRQHHLELYSLSSADERFCDVRPYMVENHCYDFRPGKLFNSPFGRLNQAVRLQDLYRLRRLNQQIAADIDVANYDVVLVHPCQYTQGPSVLHFLQSPSVYYCHEPLRILYENSVSDDERRAGWRRRLDRWDFLNYFYREALRHVDRTATQKAKLVITNSQFTQQSISRIYKVNASVSYHGVALNTFRKLDLPKENIVVSVGALTPKKGFRFIIETLGQIPASVRPELVIISNYHEAKEKDHLTHLARAHGVHLSLQMLVPNEELVRLYNVAQLLVYAPIQEPFGLVPLEAMACGTPVVAVREGGVVEAVVHNSTGLLVERDAQAFAQAVAGLLSDEAWLERLGQQAHQYVVNEWSWSKAIQKLETQLQSVINSSEVRLRNASIDIQYKNKDNLI